MPRGGKRVGAGGRFKWNHGKTIVVRIPESIRHLHNTIKSTNML